MFIEVVFNDDGFAEITLQVFVAVVDELVVAFLRAVTLERLRLARAMELLMKGWTTLYDSKQLRYNLTPLVDHALH